jgi:uncharacterized Zn finger protein
MSWQYPLAQSSSPRLRAPTDGIVAAHRSQRGWLAQRWSDTLDAAGQRLASRIARGRTLARGGRVRELWFAPGMANAEVVDREHHQVSYRIPTFDETTWQEAHDVLLGNLQHIAHLLEGGMSRAFVEELASRGTSLLPKPSELHGDCSCGDYVLPCVHMCAVHTVLADALEGEPFLLLTLRGRPREQVIATLRRAWGDEQAWTPAQVQNEEPPPGPEVDWFESPAKPQGISFAFAPAEVEASGLRALGPPPGDDGLLTALLPLYERGAEAAIELAHSEGAARRPAPKGVAMSSATKARSTRKSQPTPSLTERLVDTLAEMDGAKSKELAAALDVAMLEVRTELLHLEKLGIVYRTGQTRGTRWHLG